MTDDHCVHIFKNHVVAHEYHTEACRQSAATLGVSYGDGDALLRLAEAAMALDDQTLLWHTGEILTDEVGPYQQPGNCVVCGIVEGEHEDGCPVPPFRAAVAEWRKLL